MYITHHFIIHFPEDGSSWTRKYLGNIGRLPKFIPFKNQDSYEKIEQIKESRLVWCVSPIQPNMFLKNAAWISSQYIYI